MKDSLITRGKGRLRKTIGQNIKRDLKVNNIALNLDMIGNFGIV